VCVAAVAHHVVAALVLHERLVAAGTLSANGMLYFKWLSAPGYIGQFKRSKNGLYWKKNLFSHKACLTLSKI
jgi:hypothetical protein